jgi:ribokinase
MGPKPRIAILGVLSWDRLVVVPSMPPVGDYAVATEEVEAPGGASGNTAVVLARIGAAVTLVGRVGEDADGERLRAALADEPGIDATAVTVRLGQPTDRCTIVVTRDPPDRTIFWHPGAAIAHRDPLDLTGLFAHDVVVMDMADHALRRWLTDLPAHSSPRTRLLGTTTFLVEDGHPATPDALEVALRFDTLVANVAEIVALTGTDDLDAATDLIRGRMVGSNMRTCVISRGADGCRVCERGRYVDVPGLTVDVVDPTGAGDAFAAGVAWGMARRWSWERTARLANALGASAITAYGAQGGLVGPDALATLAGVSVAELFGTGGV